MRLPVCAWVRLAAFGLAMGVLGISSAAAESAPAVVESPLVALARDIEAGAFGAIVAVVVEQGGQPLYARRFRDGAHRRPSPDADPALHDIRSAGKSLTALAVGAALADGALESLDVPVWPLLGSDSVEHAGITVGDLLTMTSALDCSDWDTRSPGFEERMYRRKDWTRFALAIPVDPAWERTDDGLGRFSYCTAGVFLLGRVVEAVVGEPFDVYARRRILEPLGVGEVVWTRSKTGEVQAGGQLEIVAADLAKIGRMLLDGGSRQGTQVLPPERIEQLLTPRRTARPGMAYASLFWFAMVPSPSGPTPTWFMLGNGGNVVALVKDYDAVVVVQAANYNQPTASDRSFDIVKRILAGLEAPRSAGSAPATPPAPPADP